MKYAKQGLYTLMYRGVDSKYWSGCYEIMIEKIVWVVAYMGRAQDYYKRLWE